LPHLIPFWCRRRRERPCAYHVPPIDTEIRTLHDVSGDLCVVVKRSGLHASGARPRAPSSGRAEHSLYAQRVTLFSLKALVRRHVLSLIGPLAWLLRHLYLQPHYLTPFAHTIEASLASSCSHTPTPGSFKRLDKHKGVRVFLFSHTHPLPCHSCGATPRNPSCRHALPRSRAILISISSPISPPT